MDRVKARGLSPGLVDDSREVLSNHGCSRRVKECDGSYVLVSLRKFIVTHCVFCFLNQGPGMCDLPL